MSSEAFDSLNSYREKYQYSQLTKANINSNPFAQFKEWFDHNKQMCKGQPNIIHVATASKEGRPSNRVCLLKSYDEQGFVFFTNYNSKKANNLSENPHISILFFFEESNRQIRVEGTVEKVSDAYSKEYFDTRGRDSRISAWASQQSEAIENKAALDAQFDEMDKQFPGNDIPLPEFWGGYRVIPDYFEFWQGRPNRLHDRIIYEKQSEHWDISRIQP